MKVIHETKYKTQVQPAPWHDKLQETMTMFQNMNHINITSKEGFDAIMSSEANRDRYIDMVASLVGNDENTKDIIKNVARHSMEDVKSGFSTEAADAMANNATYSTLAKLNTWVIVGYTARSKCLEMYHTFSSDDPTVSFKYNLDYIVKGNDPTQYYRPQAERDGDLANMYDLPQLSPDASLAGKPGYEYLENDASTESTNGGSTVWIKIEDGVQGNFFTDNGNDYDRTKYTLEKNPQITGIKYSIPNPEDEHSPFTGSMKVYFDRKTSTGEQQKKIFMEQFSIPYANGTKTIKAGITGEIDLDSADYMFAGIGPITAIQCDVRLTNVANEMGTIRSGVKQVIEDFNVDNHPYASVPVAPEVSDDFNVGGEGVSAVAYATDKVTSALASMRDMVMERELDRAYDKPVNQFKLFPKLGGWKGSLSFPLAARMAGGSDPYSWMKIGLKTTIINHLARSEMDTYFEDSTPRQWYILGHEQDVNLIPDVTYSNWDGEGGVGGASDKYGFNVNGKAGFIDNMGRSVRVIGSAYKRHYQDANGNRRPMRAVMKSLDLEQPTSLYLPYSFRVYSGISPEYSKRTGLLVSVRDCIKIMSADQSRITLIGNSDDLYGAISTSNNAPAINFPDDTNTLTIKAEE